MTEWTFANGRRTSTDRTAAELFMGAHAAAEYLAVKEAGRRAAAAVEEAHFLLMVLLAVLFGWWTA